MKLASRDRVEIEEAKMVGVEIDRLLREHRERYYLARPFYVDEGVIEAEFQHIISRQWPIRITISTTSSTLPDSL